MHFFPFCRALPVATTITKYVILAFHVDARTFHFISIPKYLPYYTNFCVDDARYAFCILRYESNCKLCEGQSELNIYVDDIIFFFETHVTLHHLNVLDGFVAKNNLQT